MDNEKIEQEFARKVLEDASWFFAHRYILEGLDAEMREKLERKFEEYSKIFAEEIKLSIEDAILEEQKFLM